MSDPLSRCLARAAAAGRDGMRRNLKPGILLWLLGLALVLAYYHLPALRPAYDTVRDWKLRGGFAFSALSSALCGGLIPFVVELAAGRIPRRGWLAAGAFLILFWVYRGVEVDAFYRLQGFCFGNDPGVRTVACKTAADMLGYTAFWSIPTTTLAYFLAHECGWDFARFRAGLDREMLLVKIPALILAAWAVWAPSVCIIYSMPAPLQVPLFSVVLCFWVLLVNLMNPAVTKTVTAGNASS